MFLKTLVVNSVFVLLVSLNSYAESDMPASISTIHADFEAYEGSVVRVHGYLWYHPEEYYVLFFSKKHAEHEDYGNAIAVFDEWKDDGKMSLDYCPIGYAYLTGEVSRVNGRPVILQLRNASFIYNDEGTIGEIGCHESVGVRGNELLEE